MNSMAECGPVHRLGDETPEGKPLTAIDVDTWRNTDSPRYETEEYGDAWVTVMLMDRDDYGPERWTWAAHLYLRSPRYHDGIHTIDGSIPADAPNAREVAFSRARAALALLGEVTAVLVGTEP